MEEIFSVRPVPGLDAKTNWLPVNLQSQSNFDFDFDLWLSQLRVVVVKRDKLIAEAGGCLGTQRKGNVRRLKAATKQRLVKTEKT
jgi:hypothetical protein